MEPSEGPEWIIQQTRPLEKLAWENIAILNLSSGVAHSRKQYLRWVTVPNVEVSYPNLNLKSLTKILNADKLYIREMALSSLWKS